MREASSIGGCHGGVCTSWKPAGPECTASCGSLHLADCLTWGGVLCAQLMGSVPDVDAVIDILMDVDLVPLGAAIGDSATGNGGPYPGPNQGGPAMGVTTAIPDGGNLRPEVFSPSRGDGSGRGRCSSPSCPLPARNQC